MSVENSPDKRNICVLNPYEVMWFIVKSVLSLSTIVFVRKYVFTNLSI